MVHFFSLGIDLVPYQLNGILHPVFVNRIATKQLYALRARYLINELLKK